MITRHQKKLKVAEETMELTLQAFIPDTVSSIMAFLDVRSLVRFGATDKKNHGAFKREVVRRKARFAAIKQEISALLMTENDSGHVQRESLDRALALKAEAFNLIDAGLDWMPRHQLGWRFPRGNGEPKVFCSCNRDRLFQSERKQLMMHGYEDLNDQLMLPPIFYRGPFSTDYMPAPDYVQGKKNVLFVWGAENHMGHVHSMTMFTPFQDPNHPLLQFQHPMAQGFCNIIWETAMEGFVDIYTIESFRIVARKFVKERPYSMPCLHFTLAVMEKLMLRDVEEENEGTGAGNKDEDNGPVEKS